MSPVAANLYSSVTFYGCIGINLYLLAGFIVAIMHLSYFHANTAMLIKLYHLPNNNWTAIKEDIEFSPDASYLRQHYAVHRVSDYAFAILSRRPEIDAIIENYGGVLSNDAFRTNLAEGNYPFIHGNDQLAHTFI